MKPKIAIVVPVYNAGKFLERGLECLRNQTIQDIQIICVNDASADNSKEILERLAAQDSRIVVLNHETNKGASAARNTGLDYIYANLPEAEYIAFFDADDKIELDAYEKAYAEGQKSGADIVNFQFLPSQYWEYKTESTAEPIEFNGNCLDAILGTEEFYTFVVCWSKIYKKELLEELRFADQKFFEDGAFAYKVLARAKKLRVIPDVLYQYNNENVDSTCNTTNEQKRLRDIFKTMKDTLEDWQELGISEKYKYQFIKNILLYTSLVCPNVIEGNYTQELQENLGIDPTAELTGENVPEVTKGFILKMTTEQK